MKGDMGAKVALLRRPVTDMDYTLIHYNVKAWEGLSYRYGLEYLQTIGCPVEGLKFQPGKLPHATCMSLKLTGQDRS